MATVAITIGRNVGRHGKLDDDSWRQFRAYVKDALAVPAYSDGRTIVETVTESTAALGFDPVTADIEESYIVVASVDTDRLDAVLGLLRLDLRSIAANYGQESIALTVGHTTFVESA